MTVIFLDKVATITVGFDQAFFDRYVVITLVLSSLKRRTKKRRVTLVWFPEVTVGDGP